MVNILRGKTNSANLTERSPLLRFSQDERSVFSHILDQKYSILSKKTWSVEIFFVETKLPHYAQLIMMKSDLICYANNSISRILTVIFPPSITYLTLHDPSFVGGEEPWDNSSLDLERRCRLGSEVTSLSLSRSSSSDKSDPLDNLNLNFKLTSSMRWEPSCSDQQESCAAHMWTITGIIWKLLYFIIILLIVYFSGSYQMLFEGLQSCHHLYHCCSLQRKWRSEGVFFLTCLKQ